MIKTIRGIDFGIFSRVPSAEEVDKLVADGYEVAVIGLYHGQTVNHKAAAQLQAFSGKMHLCGYLFHDYEDGLTDKDAVRTARNAAGTYWDDLKWVALDYEHDISHPINTKVLRALEEVRLRGQRPVIYTAFWAWTDFMRNTVEFMDVPLWYAQYNDIPILGTPNPGYGNFHKIIGHQYKGSTRIPTVRGQTFNVDLNMFDKDFLLEKESTMAEPTANQWLKAAGAFATAARFAAEKRRLPESLANLVRFYSH